jgi:AbrB family looped-hinge helix DNA binding protein
MEMRVPVYPARMSSKGQFVMPAEVREALSLKEGDRIEFFLSRSGRLSMFPLNRPVSSIFGLGAGQPAMSEHERLMRVADEITSRGLTKTDDKAA